MISAVILARNEACNILPCIESIRSHVNEILLIDMESDDNTVALAKPHVSSVLPHKRVGNFDVARNVAIPVAKYDWLWFVDADERIPTELGTRVRELIASQGEQIHAVVLPFKSYFCGKWIQHCGWWPGYTMPRVLKRGFFRFNEELHSGVSVQGHQVFLPADPNVAVEHYSYRSIEHYVEKFNRYTSTEAENLARRGASLDWREGVRSMVRDLWLYYERQEGRSEGTHGWILSWLAGQYRWFTHAKLLDQGLPLGEVQAAPNDLDAVVSQIEEELSRCRKEAPKLPLGVLWRSSLWDASGYSTESRLSVRALASLNRSMALDASPSGSETSVVDGLEAVLLKTIERVRRPMGRVSVTAGIPTQVRPDPAAAVNVLRTTFETDRIPPSWLPYLDGFDEIWVWSNANRASFRRGGVPPEKIRVIPGCIDTDRFQQRGRKLPRHSSHVDRFVFLSVFDWHRRKGWDILLKAYCEEFSENEGVGLLLKVTLNHVRSIETVKDQADEILASIDTSLDQRRDIVLHPEPLSEDDIAAIYRSTDAFVLPSRAEGWGRPYLEAMASGIPAIGPVVSGQADFMDASNCYPVDSFPCDVSPEAAQEVPAFAGHRWFEPDVQSIRSAMRSVLDGKDRRVKTAKRAAAHVRARYSIASAATHYATALKEIEERFLPVSLPLREPGCLRVDLEGELFAGHSFSRINEVICARLLDDDSIDLGIRRVMLNPVTRPTNRKERLMERIAAEINPRDPDVVIRHAFPPNWSPPRNAKWIHIQPWEYGSLPISWATPLIHRVDEIWVPSQYVRKVYERSGVPEDKIQVIPWGVDPTIYSPDVPDLILPTQKSFRFLFVGGALERKGIDLLMRAYLDEFNLDDDVCLIVKDMGTNTFYRQQTYQDQIRAAIAVTSNPEIIYLDSFLTEGQLASLYRACHCLVAPYRGEGFGLPILEAMACGVPAIVPEGGPSDDFVDAETGFRLPARTVECDHPMRLKGLATELLVDVEDLRREMRFVHKNRDLASRRGSKASKFVHAQFTWEQSIDRMKDRIRSVCGRPARMTQSSIATNIPAINRMNQPLLSLVMIVRDNERTIEQALKSIRPWVDEMIVVDTGSLDSTPNICRRLGAKVFNFRWCDDFSAARNESIKHATGDWIFWMDSDDTIDEINGSKLRKLVQESPLDGAMGYVLQVHCPAAEGSHDLTVVDHVKLFRNRPDIRFEGRIHEQILTAIREAKGEVSWSDIYVVHAGADRSTVGRQQKLERDLRILLKDLIDRPGHPFVLFNLGMTYADAREHETAIDYLLQSIAVSSPEHSHVRKAYALLVASAIAIDKWDDATLACQNGRKLFPLDSELLFREGMVHHHFGRLSQAEKSYLQALTNNEERHFASIDPGIVGIKARHNLARVYEDMNEPQKAIEQWQQITRTTPDYRAAWRALVDLRVQDREQQGRDDLLKEFDRVAKAVPCIQPEYEMARIKFALVSEKIHDALRLVRDAVHAFPDEPAVEALAAQVLFEHGDPKECIAVLESTIRQGRADASTFHNLGSAHMRSGNFLEAANLFRRSLELRPRYALTAVQLGHALCAIGQADEARAIWKQALRDSPGDPLLAAVIRQNSV